MRRLVLFAFGGIGALALSCQVLPEPDRSALTPADDAAALPSVDAGPPQPSLAETIAWVEGGATSPGRGRAEWDAERVFLHLQERHTGLSLREVEEVAQAIVAESARRNIDVNLVLGVIAVESAGYHRAVSSVGALGLMQIMPATGEQLAREHGVEWHGPETLFDPVINVRLGIAYLRELSDRYDHVPTALAAYNWGPGRIDSRLRRGAEMPQLYIEQVQRAIDKVQPPESEG
jgi:soluble lytic murein transglycosylase-like protein